MPGAIQMSNPQFSGNNPDDAMRHLDHDALGDRAHPALKDRTNTLAEAGDTFAC
jgi:hypothetical protein